MELFLLIAIGLSLISFISVALTKTPQQTFSTDNIVNEYDLTDEEPRMAPFVEEEQGNSTENVAQKGSSGFLSPEELLAPQAV